MPGFGSLDSSSEVYLQQEQERFLLRCRQSHPSQKEQGKTPP